MRESLQRETDKLVRSWMRHEPAMLRDYLVADVEDPRLNIQSIITRQFLVSALFGGRFQQLMDEELRFAVATNWLLALSKTLSTSGEWQAVAHALRRGADEAEGIEIPACIRRICPALPVTADGLPVPNYLDETLRALEQADGIAPSLASALDLFIGLWRRALADEMRCEPVLRVLEPGCGSANDYRFLEACGLARLLDYTGFDLCEKNVLNARALFPGARFETGNVFDIAAPDKSFDCLFVHDLFEHLSPEGLEAAAAEICRVTRRRLCLAFFSMDEIPEHVVRPLEDYHWNTLSVDRTRELFSRHGFAAQAVHIGTFLRWAAGCEHTHNQNAYTLLLQGEAPLERGAS
jgi:SAM-dependent methyltransferase